MDFMADLSEKIKHWIYSSSGCRNACQDFFVSCLKLIKMVIMFCFVFLGGGGGEFFFKIIK